MRQNRGIDRRVQRTRNLLHEALASLIHEKSYDDIVVKEILARADVGRSTFYSHFRDKDELLDSGIRDILRDSEISSPALPARFADYVLRFSPALFEHIARYRNAAKPPVIAKRQSVVHDRLERELAALIAHDLERWGDRVQHIPADLLSRHVASTFLVVLNWWLGNAAPISASKANEIFRSLVQPALMQAVG